MLSRHLNGCLSSRFGQLTVQEADLATLVIAAEGNRIALLRGHYANCPLAVGALNVGVVVGVVLSQYVVCAAGIKCSLDRVPAIRFVLPCDDRRLGGRHLEVTGEGDGLEEDDNVPLGRTLDCDGQGRILKALTQKIN